MPGRKPLIIMVDQMRGKILAPPELAGKPAVLKIICRALSISGRNGVHAKMRGYLETSSGRQIHGNSSTTVSFLVLAFVAFAFLLPACAASDKAWTEVRSQHFRVITDGSEKDARRVAREFEQIRFAMSSVYPKLRLEAGAPLLVMAPRDEAV